MKKFILFVSAIAALFFFSCAGSGSSASEGDIGYLSFGSPRAAGLAAFGLTSASLTNLTLKGTKDGTTKTLGSWSTGAEATGTTIAIQAGTWTFELSAKNNGDNFTAAKTVEIKTGQHNEVAFTMSYTGRSVDAAQTGDIIMSDGTSKFAIPQSKYAQCSDLINTATVESIALKNGSTIYGVYPTGKNSMNYSNASSQIQLLGGGWYMPSQGEALLVINARTTIDDSISASGQSPYINNRGGGSGFWTSTPSGNSYKVVKNSTTINNEASSTYHYILPLRKYN